MAHKKITILVLFLILALASNSWADSNWGTMIWGQDNWYADDTDNDGLYDFNEINIYGTSPVNPDTDGDGLDDGEEVIYWGDDWDKNPDGDQFINLLDPDSDNDGILDGEELLQCESDPADANSRCKRGLSWLMLLLD